MSWPHLTFLVLATASLLATFARLRAQGFAGARPHRALFLALLVVPLGLLGISAAERAARDRLVRTVEGFGPVYAHELEHLGHARITADTPLGDPTYLALIEARERWLAANPAIANLYTLRRTDEGAVGLWVDSRTDREGERESHTRIGEPYPAAALDVLHGAFEGRPAFEDEITVGRRGARVTAYHPLRDAAGRVEAVLGIDYRAASWVAALEAARWERTITLLLALLVLEVATLWIGRMNARLLEAHRQEQRLEQEVVAAEAAGKARAAFLANMSHEIRAPLNGILGTTELLAGTPLTPRQMEDVRTAQASARHLLALVNDVLDLSRLESGGMVLERAPFGLRDLLDEIRTFVGARAADQGLELVCRVSPDLPDRVLGDALRLRQILLNLADNAVKFTARGRVTIEAEASGADLVVRVRDTGIGIEPAKLRLIFSRFTQADASTTRRFGGSGLGLAIASELATLMKGRIEARSEPGQGSEFTLTLPLEIDDETRLLPPEPVLPPTVMPGLAVLLVEDNAVNRRVCEAMLIQLECEVTTAADGRRAVELARSRRFDVVLMDCQMPEMDGYEAAAAIRALPGPHGEVPVLALTAHAGPADRARCLEVGMNGYLTKPIARRDLLVALAETCPPEASRLRRRAG